MSTRSADANSDYTPGLDRLTRYALIALAVAQALALYGLAQASDAFDAPRWLYGAYVVVGLLPLLFYLGCERLYDIHNLIAAVLLAPLLFGLGWHLGWLCEPFENHSYPTDAFLLSFALSMGAAVFVLASYLRAWTAQHKPVFHYPLLLIYTHEQLFCIVLVSVFLGIAWGLLTLWAMLFDAIGITLFSQLLNNELFGYLCNGLIAGIALVVIRNQPRLIATLSAITRALLRVLLVPVALAILLFALALPWVGVEQIWATGRAASLMMMLSVVLLALFATAFLEAPQETGYPRPLRALVWGGRHTPAAQRRSGELGTGPAYRPARLERRPTLGRRAAGPDRRLCTQLCAGDPLVTRQGQRKTAADQRRHGPGRRRHADSGQHAAGRSARPERA
ncbi:hypothetical protein S4A8_02450 [Salinisphaera sp. S4-8]